MARFDTGATIRAREDDRGRDDRDEARWALTSDGDDVGRIRGAEVSVGDLTATRVAAGERSILEVARRTPVLRLDPAGRKATWMTLSRFRARLSRLRWRPLQQRWVMTRDVEGPVVLRVGTTPLGTSVEVGDTTGLTDQEVEALIAGALCVALDVPVEVRADA